MWKLHLLLKKYLEELGAEVILTRLNQSVDKALEKRGMTAKDCDLFLSLHSNAVGNYMNELIDYVAVYHLTNDTTTECDDISAEIAKVLAPVIADVMGIKQGYRVLTRQAGYDRNGDGIMNDNYYAVLHGARKVETPGLILEHSFHTNSNTVAWLLNDANLDRLARAEAEAIAGYFSKNSVKMEDDSEVPYLIKVANVPEGDVLYIRKEPNANATKKGQLAYNNASKFTIVEERNGWGRLKSGAGWINLKYTVRV
jgi:N-acetylmuramoyl-L-alanine amidase